MPARIPPALARASLPPSLLEVLRTLDAAGHRSWLVGGAVRDLLLHRPRPASDFDVATPARPEQVTKLFRRVIPTGIEHGTVTVLAGAEQVEVTTFRGEGAYVDGRRPESVTFHSDLTADLARRDFTMNALAWDPIGGEFRDPFRGREDVRRRIIRAVGDPAARFGEDGLRPMRAVRFAAQLGYAIERKTLAAIPGALQVTRKVSVERICEELSRLLVARSVTTGLELLRSTGLLAVALPALAPLPAPHLRHAFRVAGWVEADLALRFTAALHLVPAPEAEQAALALRLPVKVAAEVGALLSHAGCLAGRPVELPDTGPALRRWLSQVGPERVPHLLALARADARDLPARSRHRVLAALRKLQIQAQRELEARPPLAVSDLALDGRAVMAQLGLPPGRQVGDALRHLLERALDDPGQNTGEKLSHELKRWWTERSTREGT